LGGRVARERREALTPGYGKWKEYFEKGRPESLSAGGVFSGS